MKVAGILSISNAGGLGYPFLPVIKSMSPLCDKIIVGVDPAYPGDRESIEALSSISNKIEVVDASWDRSNRVSGGEIALQMQKLVDRCTAAGCDWVLVLQADELVHEDDAKATRHVISNAPKDVTGFTMQRAYFWKDLLTVRADWSHGLVRLFRPGTHTFIGGDGMFSKNTSSVGRDVSLPYLIYHYSRMGDPRDISRRIRNLDTFFHAENSLIVENDLPEYDFQARPFDNFNADEVIPVIKGKFVKFRGSHPHAISGYY